MGSLPTMAIDAERLLAALLIRLPMADPSGIWTLSQRHLGPAWRGKPSDRDPHDANGAFLWGHDRSWHFRWDGPASAVDIAAALTDTLVGLADATAVFQRWRPLAVRLGTASLTLHGNL